MSLGFGAQAELISEDENTVIYSYCGYSWNDPGIQKEPTLRDGFITIERSCFAEPAVHERLRKMPGGRKKLVTKRIPNQVDYRALIRNGLIEVENCSNCWCYASDVDGVDVSATWLLGHIFERYQSEGKMPEIVNLFK